MQKYNEKRAVANEIFHKSNVRDVPQPKYIIIMGTKTIGTTPSGGWGGRILVFEIY